MVDKIENVLMKRDGLSREEAKKEVEFGREELYRQIENGENPFNFCTERWGLEPDYLEELLF